MATRNNLNTQVNTDLLSTYVPNNKLAIIIDCQVNNMPAEECCEAVADIIPGSDMMFSSRLSGGRICVFLRNEQNVKSLVQEGGLLVRGNYLPIRRYVTQATKILLSNVSPIFSNDQLSKELTKFGKLASTIRNISNGYKRPDIAHMISFRKCVYMIIDKPENIPDSFSISHEGTNYVVYVSSDDLKCNRCHMPGHKSIHCDKVFSQQPRLENDTRNSNRAKSYADTVSNTSNNTPAPNVIQSKNEVTVQQLDTTVETTILLVPKNRRDIQSEIPSQSGIQHQVLQEVPKDLPTPKRKNKRKLTPDKSNDETQEQVAKKLLEDDTNTPTDFDIEQVDSDSESIKSFDSSTTVKSDTSESSKIRASLMVEKGNRMVDLFVARINPKPHYPLSNKKFNDLLKQTYGCKPQQLLAVILEFTDDLKGLQTMIGETIHRSGHFNMKRRLERIEKTINEELTK